MKRKLPFHGKKRRHLSRFNSLSYLKRNKNDGSLSVIWYVVFFRQKTPTGQQAGARDPEALADQLLLVSNAALASASIFGEASPAVQLKTIATHLIDLQTPF